MRLRLLADDLTGALDSAAAFAGDVPVFLDAPGATEAPVSAVATATRDVPPATLPALLAPARAWLREADLAFKKVDSLLRGNTFAECAALAADYRRVVFAPAFPRQGRVTVDGRAWVRQPGASALVPIVGTALAGGFAGVAVPSLWVPEVRDDADLLRIARLSLQPEARGWLWCGSAGLAHALAEVHGRAAGHALPPASPGPVLLVSASHHAVVRRQWARLQSHGGADLDLRCVDLSAPGRLDPEAAAAALAAQTQALVEGSARPGTLVVIGGDTLRALCRAAGTDALLARAAPRPGWGQAQLVGGRWDGLRCHSRSGAFGSDDDLVETLRAIACAS